MQPIQILLLIASYFGLLILISYFTGKKDSNQDFFRAGQKSPWYVVAFGMVGATLSGVTFISVPGWVRDSKFGYMQVVFGYLFGYFVIAFLLIPLYYKINTISIYQYLKIRFGVVSHKVAAFFFFISKLLVTGFRLYLAVIVLQQFVFKKISFFGNPWPFTFTIILAIFMIWSYTFRGGIKTIVWTDSLQTLFMIVAAWVAVTSMLSGLDWTFTDFLTSKELSTYSKVFFVDNFLERTHLSKQFFGGMFIAICMTGLDQDMMQKNLSCPNPKAARKNILSFGVVLMLVNFLFLLLGTLLFIYAEKNQINIPSLHGKEKTDLLFPEIAINSQLGLSLAVFFILGLMAATFSSADSALTALTTSVAIDFLNIEERPKARQKKLRRRVHIILSVLLMIVVIAFNTLNNKSVIEQLLVVAGYTYGPLLGLFAFGIFTKQKINDSLVWLIAVMTVVLTYTLSVYSKNLFGGYVFGLELIIVNGIITFLGLALLIRKK